MILSKKHWKILLGIGAVVLIPLYFIFDPATAGFFPPCPFHALTGLHCPGCGSQRALHCALNGDVHGVLSHNVFFALGLGVFAYHNSVKLYNKYTNKQVVSWVYSKYAPLIIGVTIVIFCIVRNIPYAPFSWLAPDVLVQ